MADRTTPTDDDDDGEYISDYQEWDESYGDSDDEEDDHMTDAETDDEPVADPYAPNAGIVPLPKLNELDGPERVQYPYEFSWAEDGGARKTQTIMAYDDDHAQFTAQLWIDRTRLVDKENPHGRGPNKTARMLTGPRRIK